jgi:WD40 repeat protein
VVPTVAEPTASAPQRAPEEPTVTRNPALPPVGARLVVQRASAGGLGAAVAVSKDGLAATWSDDDTLRIWHLASRSLVRVLPGKTLGGGALVHPVRPVWDDASKEVLLGHRDGLLGVDVNGKQRLRPWANAADQVQELYPVAAGRARWIGLAYGAFHLLDASGHSFGNLTTPEKLGSDLAVSADGKWAMAAFDKGLVRFDLSASPIAAKTIKLKESPTARDMVTASQTIALTPTADAAYVCVRSPRGEESIVSVSNLGGAPNIRAVKLPDVAKAGCRVAASPDGRFVVAAMGDSLFGIDAHTVALRWRAPITEIVTALAADPHGRGVVALRASGPATILDARSGNPLGDLGEQLRAPDALAFLKDDGLVTSGRLNSIFGGTHVASWSLKEGNLRETADVDWGVAARLAEDGALHVARVATSPACAKGERAAQISFGTLASGAPTKPAAKGVWPPEADKDAVVCLPPGSNALAVDPDGGRVVIEQRQGATRTYAVIDPQGASHPLAEVPAGGFGGTQLWFSREGRWVFAAPGVRGGFSSLHVWSAQTGDKVGVFTADPADPPGATIGVARKGYWAEDVSDDGTVLAVGSEDKVTLYELPSKKVVRTVAIAGGSYVTAVAMAAGSSTVVLAGLGSGDLVTSRAEGPLLTGDSTGGAIVHIRARADRTRVATMSDDGAVRVWEARTMEPLAALLEYTDGEFLATTPRGAYTGTLEAADRVRWVFDGPTEGFPFQQFARAFQRPDVVAARLATAAQDIEDAIGRPPRVEVTARPAERVAGAAVSVSVRASSPGTLTSVRAFVEGRPVVSKDVAGRAAEVTLEVPILPGLSTVTLVAFDDKGASSNPETFEVTSTKKGAGRPDLWIVAAGVGRYAKLPPANQLEASVNDARGIAAAFSAQAAAGKRFAKAHTTLLADDEVTPASLVRAIEGLSAMKPDDLAVVFLAGHGVKARGSDEMVFLTSGGSTDPSSFPANGVGWTKIGAALGRAKGRVLVLVDACHSGHMVQELIVPNTSLADDLVRNQRAGVVVFAASKGRQLSYEARTSRGLVLSPEQEGEVTAKNEPTASTRTIKKGGAPAASLGHGFFTGAILRTLETASSDVDGDGSIELSELITQVTLRVSKSSNGAQTPWVARRELFGDFVIARAAK